jgi:hypothetical protein
LKFDHILNKVLYEGLDFLRASKVREFGVSRILRLLSISSIGELESWRVTELESWRVGELESWRVGELESWRVGELESWRVQYFESLGS